eukprot:14625-Eustigmatos_ZCMA.PRE.1
MADHEMYLTHRSQQDECEELGVGGGFMIGGSNLLYCCQRWTKPRSQDSDEDLRTSYDVLRSGPWSQKRLGPRGDYLVANPETSEM